MMIMMIMGIEADRMDTCQKQHDCFDITMELANSGVCGEGGGVGRHLQKSNATRSDSDSRELTAGRASECEWKVCMTWRFDKPGCQKKPNGDITNVCSRSDDYCSSAYDFGEGVLKTKVGTGHTECVTAQPNAGATFLVRDKTCKTTQFSSFDMGEYPTAYCARKSDISLIGTCGGSSVNGSGKECFWTFSTPSCPGPTAAPSPSPAPGPTHFNIPPMPTQVVGIKTLLPS